MYNVRIFITMFISMFISIVITKKTYCFLCQGMAKLLLLFVLFFSVQVFSRSAQITAEAIKELSFKRCMDINYSAIDFLYQSRVDDYSYFWVKVAIDEDAKEKIKALDEFIRLNTGKYYLNTSRSDNGENAQNKGILALCMDFYESNTLDEYIKNRFQD